MNSPGDKITVRTIALIENDDDDEFFFRRMIRKAAIGAHVVRLSSGRDAIAYFGGKDRYADRVTYPLAEMVFLDVNMDDGSGFDVLTWLRTHGGEDRPFVAMLTSSELDRDRRTSRELGADCFLVKPLSLDTLREFAPRHGMHWLLRS